MESDKKYCMCCDEEVTFHSILREGKREVTCVYCGFVLDVVHDDELAVKASCIVTADDTELIRELLRTQLLKSGLASEVQAFPDGQQAVTLISKRFAEGKPVDCVILDLEMPVMNGITAARVIRSLEERFAVPSVPLVFFSSKTCNEDLKKKLALFSPASYINKGDGSQPEQLLKRINQLIAYLLKKRQES
jgi:CheY-like chemotaxis protein